MTGIVRNAAGAPAVNLVVRLANAGNTFTRQMSTDTSGRFTLLEIPVGDFNLSVTEPVTQVQTNVPITIVAASTITRDLALNGIGTVAGTVSLASGAAAAVVVQLYVSTTGAVQATQTTNASGVFSFANRAVGQSYRVRAFHPVETTQFKETTNQLLASHGQTLTLNVTLPAQATLRVTVRRPDGSGLANARVQIRDAFATAFREAGECRRQWRAAD